MYSCKLGSFALILALSVSHHFILLQGQEPTESPPSPPLETSTLDSPTESPLPTSPEPPTLDVPTEMSPAWGGIGLIAGLVSGAVALIVVFCTCFFVCRNRRTKQSAQSQPPIESIRQEPQSYAPTAGRPLSRPPSFPRVNSPEIFTYEELESATNGFSRENVLGRGGFGTVYKGVVRRAEDNNNNRIVAIKKLNPGATQGRQELITEVEIISRAHHKHIVSLAGYFIDEVEANPERPLMLVYEFITNNSLDFHLHGRGTETINWSTRMKIAVGSAKGFQYLHEGCKPKIIHRDIKPSNILLDDHFNPKIADFGLAQLLSETQTHVSNSKVMGTIGYLAPEYLEGGKISEKSDVFAFGVVLLELITGRKPRGSFTDGMVKWARPLLPVAMAERNFEKLADPKFQDHYAGEEMFRMVSCAAHCVRHSPTDRPLMSQVADALEGKIILDHEVSTPVDNEYVNNLWQRALSGVDASSSSRRDT